MRLKFQKLNQQLIFFVSTLALVSSLTSCNGSDGVTLSPVIVVPGVVTSITTDDATYTHINGWSQLARRLYTRLQYLYRS